MWASIAPSEIGSPSASMGQSWATQRSENGRRPSTGALPGSAGTRYRGPVAARAARVGTAPFLLHTHRPWRDAACGPEVVQRRLISFPMSVSFAIVMRIGLTPFSNMVQQALETIETAECQPPQFCYRNAPCQMPNRKNWSGPFRHHVQLLWQITRPRRAPPTARSADSAGS